LNSPITNKSVNIQPVTKTIPIPLKTFVEGQSTASANVAGSLDKPKSALRNIAGSPLKTSALPTRQDAIPASSSTSPANLQEEPNSLKKSESSEFIFKQPQAFPKR
jgi:hypothetical protein